MNKSVLIIMGGALLAAIFVALIVQAKLTPAPQVVETPTTEILVAARKLSSGEKLAETDTQWKPWPDTALYEGVIRRSEFDGENKPEIYGAPVRHGIETGQPVTRQSLITEAIGSNNFLAASITPGKRAVGIEVKGPARMAGGFVLPGDHVDIVLTYTPPKPAGSEEFTNRIIQRHASETIMRNVKVLAIDQSYEDSGKPRVGRTATVEVTPVGAQVLALAARMGEMTLILRRVGEEDADKVESNITTDANTSEVFQLLIGLQNKMLQDQPVGGNNVRVYSGAGVQNVPVRKFNQNGGE